MPSPDRKLRVFLCHASQDKPIVRKLYQRLNAEGWIDPWLDEEMLLPGQDWDMEIEKAVEAADAVIVCFSSKSVSKEGYIQKELRFALDVALEKPDGAIFIVPLRLDNCEMPRRLRTWHYVDYFPIVQESRAYHRILQSLTTRSRTLGNIVEKALENSKGEINQLGKSKKFTSKAQPISSKDDQISQKNIISSPEIKIAQKPKLRLEKKFIISLIGLAGIVFIGLLGIPSFTPVPNVTPTLPAASSEPFMTKTPSVASDEAFKVQTSTERPTPATNLYELLYVDSNDNDIYTFNFYKNASEKFLDLSEPISSFKLSPDQSKLAFYNSNDIYVANIEGKNLIRLTDHPANDRDPIWSPNGTKILFESNRNDLGIYEIYSINPDGTNLEGPLNFPKGWYWEWAPWDLIYTSDYQTTYFINPVTKQITAHEYTCSSDLGRTFSGERILGVKESNGKYTVKIINPNGEVVFSFDTEIDDCLGVVLSGDEEKLALASPIGQSQKYYRNDFYEGFYIHIIDRATSREISKVEVTDSGFLHSFQDIAWLPDSEQIIISTDRFFASKETTDNYLRIYNLNGMSKWVFNFSEEFNYDNYGYDSLNFFWSPDGKEMVISHINLDNVYVFFPNDYRVEKFIDGRHFNEFDWLLVE